MKITIYELLGMVKDGKTPKKIKWGCHNFEWCVVEYVALDEYGKPSLCEVVGNIECVLNDEVEILEEEPRDINVCGSWFTKSEYDKLTHSEEEKKIPEKLNLGNATVNEQQIEFKINEIINYLDYLKSKGDK